MRLILPLLRGIGLGSVVFLKIHCKNVTTKILAIEPAVGFFISAECLHLGKRDAVDILKGLATNFPRIECKRENEKEGYYWYRTR